MKRKCAIALALGLFFAVAGATALVHVKWRQLSMLHHVSPRIRLLHYLSLAIAAVCAIIYDWKTYGPTVAFTHGVISSTIAWLVVSPLGFFLSWIFIDIAWVIGILFIGVVLSFTIVTKVESRTHQVIALLFVLLFCGSGLWFTPLAEHTLGIGFLLLAVNRIVTMIGVQCVDFWDEVEDMDAGSDEYKRLAEEFHRGCNLYPGMYTFALHIKGIYRVKRSEEFYPLAHTREGRYLYHGTGRLAAKGILNDGFRLPKEHTHGGMFGKGIYFADSPLKSWQYTDGFGALSPGVCSCVPATCRRGGLILMCWVELGPTKLTKTARTDLTTPPHRSFFEWLQRKPKYKSVMGADKERGGALRVPEYVVYKENQTQVDYVFKVTFTPPPASRDGYSYAGT